MSSMKGGGGLVKHLEGMAKRLKKAETVSAGFLEGATNNSGQSAAMIAAIQEYGAPAKGIPPRPFFRNMIKENKDQWGNQIAHFLIQTNFDSLATLGKMGEELRDQIRDSMKEITEPELSPVSVLLRERFGNNPQEVTFADVMQARRDIASGVEPAVSDTGAKPLIWTGGLQSAVNYEVNE